MSLRTGLIARKMGMSRLFRETGEHVPVTVLQLEGCKVIAIKEIDRDGYVALQLGAGTRRPGRVSQPMRGHFARSKVAPCARVVEFRVSEENVIEVGARMKADHFTPGQFVDTTGVSQGKGFAGAIKRHHFGGLRATHGVSISHRSHGSTGNCQDPGRVFKGKKMAGHMGCTRVTVQSLRVEKVDVERGVLFIRGAVPGPEGTWITVKDSVKKRVPEGVPLPGSFDSVDAEPDSSVREEAS